MLRQLRLYDKCEMLLEARKNRHNGAFGGDLIWMLIMTFVLLIIPTFIGSICLSFLIDQNDATQVSIGSLYVQIIPILAIVLYCTQSEKRSIRSIGFTRTNVFVQYFIGLIVGVCLFSTVVLIGTILGVFEFVGISHELNVWIIVLFFGGFVFQGMCEEVLCRGYIMISASRKKPVVYGIILNSIIFAILHGANPGIGIIPVVNLILFGIFTSLYALRTDNIWGVSALHSVWNFTQGNLFGFSVSGAEKIPSLLVFKIVGGDLIGGGQFGPEGGLIATMVLIVGIIILLLPVKKTALPSHSR